MDRRRRKSSGGGRGRHHVGGPRRQERNDRSRRGRPHGHRGRLGHRPRPGATNGGGGAGGLPRRAARTRAVAAGGGIPARGGGEDQPLLSRAHVARRGRRERLHVGRRPDRHRRLSGRDRRDVAAPRPTPDALALDLDVSSPRAVFVAQRADHRADQLSRRRDRHAAGRVPARAVRRRALRGQSGRRTRPAESSAC